MQQQQQQHHQIHSSHFEPASSHDDFLEQMLSTLGPSACSWPDLNPASKAPWDAIPTINGSSSKPRDLSDETAHSNHENVAFPYDDSANLTSKFRNHQISGGSKSAAAAAAAMILQQQLMMSRGAGGSAGSGAGEPGLVPLPLSLGNGDPNDVVDGSSFKSPNPVSLSVFNSTKNK